MRVNLPMPGFTESLPRSAITAVMFEGPIKAARPAGNDESPILRQLRWTDLVARIAATRDLRGTEQVEPEPASFAAFHLPSAKGQRPVNRDALSDGKLPRLGLVDHRGERAKR